MDREFDFYEWHALGLFGYDPDRKVTIRVQADIDVGHGKSHSQATVDRIVNKCRQVPWVTVRTSKSGKGIHIFVGLANPLPAPDTRAHVANCKRVLQILSDTINEPLLEMADDLNGWLRVMDDRYEDAPGAFEVLVQATEKLAVPTFDVSAIPPVDASHLSEPVVPPHMTPLAKAFLSTLEQQPHDVRQEKDTDGNPGNDFYAHSKDLQTTARLHGYEELPTEATGVIKNSKDKQWNTRWNFEDNGDLFLTSFHGGGESEWEHKHDTRDTYTLRLKPSGGGASKKKKSKGTTEDKPKMHDQLVDLGKEDVLFHNAAGHAFVTYPDDYIPKTVQIQSEEYKAILEARFQQRNNTYPGDGPLKNAINTLERHAKSTSCCPTQPTFVRQAHFDGKLAIDLCDEQWRSVLITPEKTSIVQHETPFIRYPGMLPMPVPTTGGSFDDLWKIIPADDQTKLMYTAFIFSAFAPVGPRPVLVNNSPEGSGKSFCMKRLRDLIDPNESPIGSFPRNEDDHHIKAERSFVLAYDNIDSLSHDEATRICQFATGAGFSKRTHYTNRGEEIFNSCRSQMFNGIPNLVLRGDLADRVLMVRTGRLSGFTAEGELIPEFRKVWPGIFGVICEIVQFGLQRFAEDIEVPQELRDFRMADFVKWIHAIDPILREKVSAWEPGAFWSHLRSIQKDTAETLLSDTPWTLELAAYIRQEGAFEGRLKDLLDEVNQFCKDHRTDSCCDWPTTPKKVSTLLKRGEVNLAKCGIRIERKLGRSRTTIYRIALTE